jgi:hypothetical protein
MPDYTRASPDFAQKALERIVIWHVYIDTVIRTWGDGPSGALLKL